MTEQSPTPEQVAEMIPSGFEVWHDGQELFINAVAQGDLVHIEVSHESGVILGLYSAKIIRSG